MEKLMKQVELDLKDRKDQNDREYIEKRKKMERKQKLC